MPIDQPTAPPSLFYTGPLFQTLDLHYHGQLAVVTNDGEVQINWKHVEDTAADPRSDRQSVLYAKLLLAARDGTAKPLPDAAH